MGGLGQVCQHFLHHCPTVYPCHRNTAVRTTQARRAVSSIRGHSPISGTSLPLHGYAVSLWCPHYPVREELPGPARLLDLGVLLTSQAQRRGLVPIHPQPLSGPPWGEVDVFRGQQEASAATPERAAISREPRTHTVDHGRPWPQVFPNTTLWRRKRWAL